MWFVRFETSGPIFPSYSVRAFRTRKIPKKSKLTASAGCFSNRSAPVSWLKPFARFWTVKTHHEKGTKRNILQLLSYAGKYGMPVQWNNQVGRLTHMPLLFASKGAPVYPLLLHKQRQGIEQRSVFGFHDIDNLLVHPSFEFAEYISSLVERTGETQRFFHQILAVFACLFNHAMLGKLGCVDLSAAQRHVVKQWVRNGSAKPQQHGRKKRNIDVHLRKTEVAPV